MVIVVPALAHRQKCQDEIVSAVIVGGVAALAEQMTERIDRESGVIKQYCANDEPPHQRADGAGPTAGEIAD